MSKNPEGKFYEAVERKLHPDIYKEGMANPYRGGTPDRFYEGHYHDLWVEYKWYTKLPVRGFDLTSGKSPKMTPLQQEWANRRYDKDRGDMVVIVGFPGEKRHSKMGIILIDKRWMEFVPALQYNPMTTVEIAQWINSRLAPPS